MLKTITASTGNAFVAVAAGIWANTLENSNCCACECLVQSFRQPVIAAISKVTTAGHFTAFGFREAR